MPGSRPPERWQHVAERGSVLGIRLVAWLATAFGRRAASLLLVPVAAWYAVLDRRVRDASRGYLERVLGRATTAHVIRHVQTFAQVTLDRLFLMRGRTDLFEIHVEGGHHLAELAREGRGALLLLAHLGSFEVLRSLPVARSVRTSMLGYFRNTRVVQGILDELAPGGAARIIQVRPADPTFVFEVADRIGAGELVGTMGDRVGLDGKAVEVPFLGGRAAFPTGPYLLAAALRCPVYLMFGLHRPPNRYDLHCELFAERIELPRERRQEALQAEASRFAARLEARCREAPYNWFNFFNFWSET